MYIVRNIIGTGPKNEVYYANKIIQLITAGSYEAVLKLLTKTLPDVARRQPGFDISRVVNYVDESDPTKPTIMSKLLDSIVPQSQRQLAGDPNIVIEQAFDVARELIDLGFPINDPLKRNPETMPNLTILGYLIKFAVELHGTALITCIDFANFLIEKHSDINKGFLVTTGTLGLPHEMSPLRYAVDFSRSIQWVRFLLDNGAVVDNRRLMCTDFSQEASMLEIAANSNKYVIAEMLLAALKDIPNEADKANIAVNSLQALLLRELGSRMLHVSLVPDSPQEFATLCERLFTPPQQVPLLNCCVGIGQDDVRVPIAQIFTDILTSISTNTAQGERYMANIKIFRESLIDAQRSESSASTRLGSSGGGA